MTSAPTVIFLPGAIAAPPPAAPPPAPPAGGGGVPPPLGSSARAGAAAKRRAAPITSCMRVIRYLLIRMDGYESPARVSEMPFFRHLFGGAEIGKSWHS